jgi:hypothetical protein
VSEGEPHWQFFLAHASGFDSAIGRLRLFALPCPIVYV